LLHCLAGILTPDQGEVHYHGKRIDMLPDRERSRLRRTDFGFLFQYGRCCTRRPVTTPCGSSDAEHSIDPGRTLTYVDLSFRVDPGADPDAPRSLLLDHRGVR